MEFGIPWKLTGHPGWIELRLPGKAQPRIIARFERRDGRSVITRIMLAGDALDPGVLRGIPWGRVEAVVNHPTLSGVVESIVYEQDIEDGRQMFADEISAIEHSWDQYLERSLTQPQGDPELGKAARTPLVRPDGTNPDTFSKQVADAYNDAVLRTSAPAVALAEEAGVPVGTARRWIREARQRGYLPRARKGRAG